MKWYLLGLGAGCLLLILLISFGIGSDTKQPIFFNHKKHLAQGIECDSCHRYFKTQTFSGLPTTSVCIECHKDPITESKEEEKIRKYHEKNEEIPWRRLYGQPDHVFFSHRRHVVLGKMECKNCHGDIAQSESPPSRPWVNMSMSWCMGCHARKKVTNDCLTCHV